MNYGMSIVSSWAKSDHNIKGALYNKVLESDTNTAPSHVLTTSHARVHIMTVVFEIQSTSLVQQGVYVNVNFTLRQ